MKSNRALVFLELNRYVTATTRVDQQFEQGRRLRKKGRSLRRPNSKLCGLPVCNVPQSCEPYRKHLSHSTQDMNPHRFEALVCLPRRVCDCVYSCCLPCLIPGARGVCALGKRVSGARPLSHKYLPPRLASGILPEDQTENNRYFVPR